MKKESIEALGLVLATLNLDDVYPSQRELLREILEDAKQAHHAAYQKGYADAMGWKTQNHLEHLPPAYCEQCPYLEIHDTVVKDNDRALALLRRAETEMRYAGWAKYEADNSARNGVYEQVKRFLGNNL